MPTSRKPTTIQVGYIQFTVRYLTDAEWESEGLPEGDGGQMHGFKGEIFVRQPKGQHDVHTREILLHELLHACFYVSGISINEDLRIVPDIEETTISRIAPVLLDTFRRNPRLTEFLES